MVTPCLGKVDAFFHQTATIMCYYTDVDRFSLRAVRVNFVYYLDEWPIDLCN